MRKILDIWTKTSTFPRSCLDRLEQRMKAGTPVAQSTTPPYSPGLPPLSEEDKKPRSGSNNGQGKYLSLLLVCESFVVATSFKEREPGMRGCYIKQIRQHTIKQLKLGTRILATNPRLTGGTYIHIALPPSRPLACILYRRILPAISRRRRDIDTSCFGAFGSSGSDQTIVIP